MQKLTSLSNVAATHCCYTKISFDNIFEKSMNLHL